MPSFLRTFLCSLLVTVGLCAQPLFECQLPAPPAPVPFPPLAGPPDCEGVTCNFTTIGATPLSWICGVEILPTCGMPSGGTGYAYLTCHALSVNTNPPPGGPVVRPLAQSEMEIRIPIPPGATGINFYWEFWNTEGPGAQYNDGLSVDIVDASTGLALVPLAYADVMTTPLAPLMCQDPSRSFGTEVLVDGPQQVTMALPSLPATAYLSVVAWNGQDNIASSAGAIDEITWTGTGGFALNMMSPFGAGSLQIDNQGGTPLNPYVTLLTVNQGNFPNGAVAGIDITLSELLAQLAFGAPPFRGVLDVNGGSTFAVGPGIAPSGVTLYGVTGELDPVFMFPIQVTPPVSFTIL